MNRREFLVSTSVIAASSVATPGSAQPSAKKYRACVIGDTGHGDYGHDTHLAFALQPNVEMIALADPDEAGRAKHAAECKAQRTYADYREMLAKEKPDLVAIAPRLPGRHKEYLLACVEIGAHGYMEKPLCMDLAEADAMVAAVEAKKLKWQLAYNMRVNPLMTHIKKVLAEDQIIGSVLEVRARGKEDNRAGAEDLIVLGTHLFDLMIYLLGDPLWCMADITHNGQPAKPEHVREASEPLGPVVGNRIHAMYGFEKGVAGHFSSMKTKDGSGGRWGLEIFGSKGVIAIHTEYISHAYWLDDPAWRTVWNKAAWKPIPGAPDLTMKDQARERHQYLAADLLDAIANDREPAASLQQSRKAQEMIQACFEAYTKGCRAAIPLAERTHPLKRWA